METKQLYNYEERERLTELSELGDPLERLNAAIDWDIFLPKLKKAFKKQKKANSGRPPYNYVMMFKIMILQSLNNLADDKAEMMIKDRLTYQRFLGLSLEDDVPDAKSIWLFRQHLAEKGTADELFDLFEQQLEEKGIITRKGSIVDATFEDAPRQRNSKKENVAIKVGETPEGWEKPLGKSEKEMTKAEKRMVNKLEQKDVDARWAKKNNETHYGYKDHEKVDKDSKLIVKHEVTDASVHDSQKIADLMDKKDKEGFADAGYVGKDIMKAIEAKSSGINMHICAKGYRNKPLTGQQKKDNKAIAHIRSRVEHVFGDMTNSMGGLTVRCIGIVRAKCAIALRDLAYNLKRYAYLSGDKKRLAYARG
jgi:IS5 family transposase